MCEVTRGSSPRIMLRWRLSASALRPASWVMREIGNGAERAGRYEKQSRKHLPLRLRCADRAFVLLHLAGHDGGEETGCERCGADGGSCEPAPADGRS